MKMVCDWCRKIGTNPGTAVFVIVTGRIDSMIIEDYFICMGHADTVCRGKNSTTEINIAGVRIDVWELEAISEKAKEYYHDRFVQRTLGIQPIATGGYIPYQVTQPDSGSVRRGGRFYWYKGEIWEHIPFH